MKNVVVISSSPRKDGNSETLAKEFMRGAKEAGNKTELICLRDYNLGYCHGCYACSKTGKCFQKDGIPALIFAMLFTLTVAKDLGRKKSFWLIGLSVALSLVNFIMAIVRAVSRMKEVSVTMERINAGISVEFSIFILCVIYGVMIYAKYQDKAARGTK